MGWSAAPAESFRIFQSKVLAEYDRLVPEYGLEVADASASITEQQRTLRKLVTQHLGVQAPDEDVIEEMG